MKTKATESKRNGASRHSFTRLVSSSWVMLKRVRTYGIGFSVGEYSGMITDDMREEYYAITCRLHIVAWMLIVHFPVSGFKPSWASKI